MSPRTVSNVLGVAGLVAVVVAVWSLTDWRWALGLAGLLSVAVSYLTARSTPTVAVGTAATRPSPARRLASVERAA